MDLFNNPMVESARKSLSPEQQEEYKRMGEYMFKNMETQVSETILKTNPTQDDLARYASDALKSGGDPNDLSDDELRALEVVYGKDWYSFFGVSESNVRKPVINPFGDPNFKISRQQRRFLEKKMAKMKK